MWHGFWVAYVGIPAFIVTLSSMLLFRGLDLVVLEGATVGGLPEGFKKIGNGFLPEVGPDTGYHNLTLIIAVLVVGGPGLPRGPQAGGRARSTTSSVPAAPLVPRQAGRDRGGRDRLCSYLLADARGLPIVGLILFALIAIYTLHHAPHGLRPARLRGRRQRRRGHHVRRQHQAGRLPGHDQHGPARRPRRPGLHGPPHRRQPQGRHQLRARRHRRRPSSVARPSPAVSAR